MLDELMPYVPRDALNVALLLALSFFLGLEREEHKLGEPGRDFGGLRTFPLTGLVSYALSLISAPGLLPWVIGLVVISSFLVLSYAFELYRGSAAGASGQLSALAAYVMGGLIQREYYWIATTLAVFSVLLLELKKGLEGLTRYVASEEIITAAKFLVLSAVILPIVPNRELTHFALNPFKIWLVVVAVSAVSFGSYALQRALRGRGGLLLASMLGGAYSSTVTTLVLARRARDAGRPHRFAGMILTASGVMYARLAVLLALFSRTLFVALAPSLTALALVGAVAGVIVSRRHDAPATESAEPTQPTNPLELRAAFLFAAVFVANVVLTNLALQYLGHAGMYALSVVMGVTDVDPFILGLAQLPGDHLPEGAGRAIIIAAASNNVVKSVYAYAAADRATGREAMWLLLVLAALGLLPLAIVPR